MKKIFGILLFVCICLSIGYYFFLKFNPLKSPLKVKVGTMAIVDCLQIFVAEEKGFFKNEGLEVEVTPMSGGSVIAPAVQSGTLDIGWSNLVSIIIAHEKGSDFKFFAPGAFKNGDKGNVFLVMVAKDSVFTSAKDLEGKTIAINTLGGIQEMDFKAWMEKNGASYTKVKFVAVPHPQMESALESKQIDAALATEPYGTIGVHNGVAKILDGRTLDVISDRLMIASWFAKESWILTHPNEIQAFNKAILKANRYIQDHPMEMPSILSKYTRLQKEIADQTIITVYLDDVLKQDVQVIIDTAYKYGYIKAVFNAKEIIAESLELK